jgi:predicted nuclease with TOPRIM domain
MSKIINAIIIGLLGGGCFSAGVYYATLELEEQVNVWDSNYQIITDKVYAFEKVSDPKTIRLYVKELNKILDDVTFLGKIVESGQVSSESLDSYFNEYEVKLENVKGRIKRLYSELTELEYKFKEQVTRLTGETDDNLELIDDIKEEDIKRLVESDEQFMKIVKDLDSIKVMINDLKNSKIDKFWKSK